MGSRRSSPAMRSSASVTRRRTPRSPTAPQLVRKPPPNRTLTPDVHCHHIRVAVADGDVTPAPIDAIRPVDTSTFRHVCIAQSALFCPLHPNSTVDTIPDRKRTDHGWQLRRQIFVQRKRGPVEDCPLSLGSPAGDSSRCRCGAEVRCQGRNQRRGGPVHRSCTDATSGEICLRHSMSCAGSPDRSDAFRPTGAMSSACLYRRTRRCDRRP